MTINEDPSPNLIGRQVDKSTSRQFSFGSTISTGNLKAYQMSMLPDKPISEDSFFSFGVWGLAPQASYAIMLQVYNDYYLLTAICTT